MNTTPQTSIDIDSANRLVEEHRPWAESIARAVARAWNLDWQLDGLDGAAMEALIFCSRRFDLARGVPFKGYARKRVHEAATEAARKSKGWKKGLGSGSTEEHNSREIAAELMKVFPELREGHLPYPEEGDGGGDDLRSAVRHMLVGASIIAAKQGIATSLPDEVMDYKKMIGLMSKLDPVHQLLLWKVYWEGYSMRNVADEWGLDELNVIREHKVILAFLLKGFSKSMPGPLKVRPGLKNFALKLKKKDATGYFTKLLDQAR